MNGGKEDATDSYIKEEEEEVGWAILVYINEQHYLEICCHTAHIQ